MRKNIQMYKKVGLESNVIASDPHHIITLLYNGIFDGLSSAKSAIERKDFEVKSTSLSKAINILRSLEDSLDFESEPAISNLYQYCIYQLSDASVTLDVNQIDEVVDLLEPISSAWKDISESDKQEGFRLLQQKKLAS